MKKINFTQLLTLVSITSALAISAVYAKKSSHDEQDAFLLLSPEIRQELKSVKQLEEMIGFQHITADNLALMREKEKNKVYKPLSSPSVYQKIISPKTALDGEETHQVKVYVINAQAGLTRPAILYLHGGGFVLGSAADSVVAMQKIAKEHNCVVVTVDYRLAPETTYLGSLSDNYLALQWLYHNADTLGVDKNRLVVMGSSAGGGHAAMLAIAARDKQEIPIKQQVLIYPMLDDRTGSSHKVPAWIGRLLWTEKSNNFGWSSLLGMPAGSANVPTHVVPARVENLSGLPATFIIVGSADLFVNENIVYAQRLINAGVQTELQVIAGTFHASENVFPQLPISKQFKQAINQALHKALN